MTTAWGNFQDGFRCAGCGKNVHILYGELETGLCRECMGVPVITATVMEGVVVVEPPAKRPDLRLIQGGKAD